MGFVKNTYVSVFEFGRTNGDSLERRNDYWSDRVKIKPGKPTSSGEPTVIMNFPFEDESGEERIAAVRLGASIIHTFNEMISDPDDLESRFPVLSENPPLR